MRWVGVDYQWRSRRGTRGGKRAAIRTGAMLVGGRDPGAGSRGGVVLANTTDPKILPIQDTGKRHIIVGVDEPWYPDPPPPRSLDRSSKGWNIQGKGYPTTFVKTPKNRTSGFGGSGRI